MLFLFQDTATTDIYTLSLHDALPICTAQYDARLNDWIVLEGLRAMKPAPQSEGDQRVQGNLNQLNRVTGQLDTTESLRSEEHTSELQSRLHLVCRLLLEKKKTITLIY